VQTHACSVLDNPVTLTFDLLTSGSVHAAGLPWSICLSTLLLIAQAVFLLEHRQTFSPTHTDTTDHFIQASAIAGIGNSLPSYGHSTDKPLLANAPFKFGKFCWSKILLELDACADS